MDKQPMGSGFRFKKIMGWAPAILIMFGVLLIATDALFGGLTLAMAGVVFGLTVKHRARREAEVAASN